jgi:predicted CoA-substrate-specific enzyme activase
VQYFCGIDIGSSAVKVVLVDAQGELAGQTVVPSGNNFHHAAREALDRLLEEIGAGREVIRATVSTGYGRRLFKEAAHVISEISANALGAQRAAQNGGGNFRVGTVINIGGQDSKVILLDADGRVKDFAMNDKCAAGTGRFLEMTAMAMEVEVADLGRLHLESEGVAVTIDSTCTVFANSEMISLLAAGYGRGEIIAGVHRAIARRIARLAERVGLEGSILFDGGAALNPGLASALEDELMREIVVPEIPQITTAWGAALYAGNLDRS